MDAYGLREALESAALTASRIAYQVCVIIFPTLNSRCIDFNLAFTGDGRWW